MMQAFNGKTARWKAWARMGWAAVWMLAGVMSARAAETNAPFVSYREIFPPEHWHNHGSCVVELPDGDLMACWFHGSGERKADDVRIEGARLRKGAEKWSGRFVLADTPGYPDTNCCLFVDPKERLWLMWPTILANTWESALMKYRIASDYSADGAPNWEVNEVMHVTPGEGFERAVADFVAEKKSALGAFNAEEKAEAEKWLASLAAQASDKLTRRLGWFTRAHPFVLEGRRLIVPLYSDGFSFSLMNISDDWGKTWRTSAPLIGAGSIQPSVVRRKDGSLYTLMRDNGPPPKRLHQSESRDGGETWATVTDSEVPNPGSGAEIISTREGLWLLVNNDTEKDRHRLAVWLSDDEGRTWKWRRYLEQAEEGAARFHYPSVIEARDGTFHATYSHHVEKGARAGADGQPLAKTIKHAHFNAAWVKQGN